MNAPTYFAITIFKSTDLISINQASMELPIVPPLLKDAMVFTSNSDEINLTVDFEAMNEIAWNSTEEEVYHATKSFGVNYTKWLRKHLCSGKVIYSSGQITDTLGIASVDFTDHILLAA